jgi:hypothetical protein
MPSGCPELKNRYAREGFKIGVPVRDLQKASGRSKLFCWQKSSEGRSAQMGARKLTQVILTFELLFRFFLF